jgi:hypothetical protein
LLFSHAVEESHVSGKVFGGWWKSDLAPSLANEERLGFPKNPPSQGLGRPSARLHFGITSRALFRMKMRDRILNMSPARINQTPIEVLLP